jgi:putative hydrolase of the HAD superfamily
MIRVVLFDLDGVVRHFDPGFVPGLERKHGLELGTIESAAFGSPLIEDVTTGRITRAEWVRRVGELIGNLPAAEEWRSHPSVVDEDVLELSDEVRESGLRTAVLTNGTDTIPTEIEALGIAGRFDAVFNSADIGFVKPDVRAFQHVLDALGVAARDVFFTDDTVTKLVGADELSMHVHLFRGVRQLRDALAAAGVAVRRPDRP